MVINSNCEGIFMSILRQNEKRFWSKVSIGKKRECWNWSASCTSHGYGYFSLSHYVDGEHRKYILAHRFSLMLKLDTETLNGWCLHSCDNKACCNPNHLRLGTYYDNLNDALKRDRFAHQLGEAHGRALLTEDQVRWIREEYPKGKYSHNKLAKMFKVGATTISDVIHRRKWKHI